MAVMKDPCNYQQTRLFLFYPGLWSVIKYDRVLIVNRHFIEPFVIES